ncbi:poly-gamma-glutamate hydrolase family protein [Kribbella sandramycini]|uniref:Phage replication-related protein YjqB (UPF0714/DUF867 family) n=1 Tax=Kribbella sandramycini TaxID=60450 RepID=A0A841SMJ7_9ACTN|nr:hypothetical protein [Kribbella sandramycini]
MQRTVILAPHGGGISWYDGSWLPFAFSVSETGTSELCLAIAGYHPADLTPSGPLHDYWMFEGLLASGNGDLHVKSTNCDDHTARSLAAGALNAIGLHGCKPDQAGLPCAKLCSAPTPAPNARTPRSRSSGPSPTPPEQPSPTSRPPNQSGS